MCGRIFQTLPLSRLIAIARAARTTNAESYSSSYNVCPTTYIPAIKKNKRFGAEESKEDKKQETQEKVENADPERELAFMKWGHQSTHNFIINARCEQMLGKRTFINIIENRCVVIVEGYFEWKEKSQPYMFKSKTSDHFLIAGLYTDNNEIILLTKDAAPGLGEIHDRMPVILTQEDVELWLNSQNTKELGNILRNSILKKDKPLWSNVGFTRLAPHVNTIKEKSAKCIMTFEEYKKQQDRTGIMRFFKKPAPVEKVVAENEKISVTPAQEPTPFDAQPEKRDIESTADTQKRQQ